MYKVINTITNLNYKKFCSSIIPDKIKFIIIHCVAYNFLTLFRIYCTALEKLYYTIYQITNSLIKNMHRRV